MTSASPTPLRLYLVRHGETAWSISGQHTGRTDIPLTTQGESEAQKLAPRLSGISFTQVLASPMQRAQQTCTLAGLGEAAVITADLSEWDYGDYEGVRSVDIRKQRADWNIFRDGCPHGESPEQISQRADRLVDYLRTLQGNIALFSHGQFACVLAARWIGLSVLDAQHFMLGTATLSILAYNSHHPDIAVIERWNTSPDC